jgi:ABC-2 type transport system permease protein
MGRRRTWVALAACAAIPLTIGIGLALQHGATGPGPGLVAAATGNGLGLPIASLGVALTLLLPLGVSITAADALAGEASHGTLRWLLLAPMSRPRLVAVKVVGVLVTALTGVVVVAAVGTAVGAAVVGGGGQLLTLSGTVVSTGNALARILLASGWTVVQLAAVGVVALAVSALTDRRLVVIASVLGGMILSGVLTVLPALRSLHPLLLTAGWAALGDVLRDPIPTHDLGRSTVVAACYLTVGLTVAVIATRRREP